MKIYDISQEVFSCAVYPGDPKPERQVLSSTGDGALYNLTALSMCAHNGTHVDAPFHFLPEGKTVEQMCEIFSMPLEWAPDLPLTGAGYETPFYMKD